MMNIIKRHKRFLLVAFTFVTVLAGLSPLVVAASYELAYWRRVYPGIRVKSEVLRARSSKVIRLVAEEALDSGQDRYEWRVTGEQLGVEVDWPATEKKLYSVGRSGDFILDIRDKITAYRSGIEVEPVFSYDQEQVLALTASVSAEVDRPVVEPKFKLVGTRVIEFQPGKGGRMVDQTRLTESLVGAVVSRAPRPVVQVPVMVVEPFQSTSSGGEAGSEPMTAEELGILKILGQGESTFKGSIASREYNVLLTARKLDGVLVPPGKVFSFNGAVGEVSTETGFKQAYIIREGRTVLDDGGGVCQVSTTLFRAMLKAALPVVERQAHSYRVGYYEQDSPAGFDATVYAPRVDLKFRNDTPGHLLIQVEGDGAADRLVIEIWGTSDGRVATTTEPAVWGQTPPPEELYQDDPSLAAGQIKQVDWAAWGAKVKFDYRVERGGETLIQESFYSDYRPWQAVFLRGTGG